MLWPRTGRPLPHPTFTKVTFTCYEAVKEIIRRYPLRMLVPLAVTATRVYIQRRRRAFMYNDCVKPTRRRAAGGHGAGPGGREAVRSRATARRSSTAPGQKPAGTSRSRYLPRCGIIIIIIIIIHYYYYYSGPPGQKPAGTSRSRYLPRCGIIINI